MGEDPSVSVVDNKSTVVSKPVMAADKGLSPVAPLSATQPQMATLSSDKVINEFLKKVSGKQLTPASVVTVLQGKNRIKVRAIKILDEQWLLVYLEGHNEPTKQSIAIKNVSGKIVGAGGPGIDGAISVEDNNVVVEDKQKQKTFFVLNKN